MSLERFRRPRLIALRPVSTAYEAARAMVANHIGALIVADGGALAGIVTDRDLVARVLAGGLDPMRADVGDIMTDPVAAIDIEASTSEAVRKMREHACRRLPVLERGKVVGLVTLDDLILEGAVDVEDAAKIIRAQLEAPARYKRAGAVHPEARARADAPQRPGRAVTRRSARAASAYDRFLRMVQLRSGLSERTKAELGANIVLGAVCQRVTPEEARHFVAQLPSVLQPALEAHFKGPDRSVTRSGIEHQLERALGLPPGRAHDALIGTCQAIADAISEGQIDALRGQLPQELARLFDTRWSRAAASL